MKIKTIATFSLLQLANVFANVCHEILYFESKCVSFSIGPGTGCDWMCNYCATTLGSNSYYFNPPVCTYQSGGCVGNPQTGVTYSCCTTA
jgi:hypothetical protein